MFENASLIRERINAAATLGEEFIFGIDFELSQAFFVKNPFDQRDILFSIGGVTNAPSEDLCMGEQLPSKEVVGSRLLNSYPEPLSSYLPRFEKVKKALMRGDSFLLNLTTKSRIETALPLYEIFYQSRAPYKLFIPDLLLSFSPERFVKIEDGYIFSNPMKGTISADLPDAESIIREDPKEVAEHYTIVDLIRNDISQVATDVEVLRFRYIDRIAAHSGDILQVSSEIRGRLPDDYRRRLGDIIFKLLPAGSVSGAPKESSLRIIGEAEGERRGFYSGVFGWFDGERLDSAVLIRYIEQRGNELYFRSGGGITINSDLLSEYNEMIQKIYLPISNREEKTY